MNASSCADCGGSLPKSLDGLCPRCLWADSMESSANAISGHELGAEIARGGMGVVYTARQLTPYRVVALKMLRPHLLEQPAMKDRFRQEAQAAAVLQHPGILPVYQVGETAGIPWFTMMLAEGGTLAARRGDYAGRWREIAGLVAELAGAVAHAHERGVLHRDLKPGNILFDSTGRAYVCDFGLAKVATAGETTPDWTLSVQLLGTPHYMAPEVASGALETSTISADIYALGVILYELLSGSLPFEADNIPSLLRKIVDDEAPSLFSANFAHIPRDLAAIATKCLEKPLSKRYATAGALAADLDAWLHGLPVSARPLTHLGFLKRWMRRNPQLAAMVIVFLTFLIAGGILLSVRNRQLATALDDSRSSLYASLLGAADMRLKIPTAGRSEDVLQLLNRAADNGPKTEAMSALATCALAAPDLRILHQWTVPEGVVAAFSHKLEWWIGVHAREEGIAVRSCSTGNEIRRLPSPSGTSCIHALWADAADRVILTHSDKSATVWHVQKEQPLYQWEAGDAPDHISWNARGTSMAVCRAGKDVEIISLQDGESQSQRLSAGKQVMFTAMSPDGRRILLGMTDRLCCQSVKSGQIEWEVRKPFPIQKCNWSGDGMVFAGVRNQAGSVAMYAVENGEEIKPFEGRNLYAKHLHLAAEGMNAVSVSLEGILRIWDQRGGHELLRMTSASCPPRLLADGTQLGWMPDSTHVAISRVDSPVFREHGASRRSAPGQIGALRLDGEGEVIATCGRRNVIAWRTDVDAPPVVSNLDLAGAEHTTNYDCDIDGQRLIIGVTGQVMEFPFTASALQSASKAGGSWLGKATVVKNEAEFNSLTDYGRSWVFSRPDETVIWSDGDEGKTISVPLEQGARLAHVSHCGRWILSISRDRDELIVTEIQENAGHQNVVRLPMRGILSARFSPDSRWLIAKVGEGWQLWTTGSWEVGPRLPSKSPLHNTASSGFSSDGKLLLTRTEENTISVFRLPSLQLMHRLQFPTDLHALAFQLDSYRQILWVLAEGSRLYRWDLAALDAELTRLSFIVAGEN